MLLIKSIIHKGDGMQVLRPEDIIADGVDSTMINGIEVRKGTVGAFLKNAEILNDINTGEVHRQAAILILKELAPSIIAVGLHEQVIFKNKLVEQILVEAEGNH
jgi:hypothetical protein